MGPPLAVGEHLPKHASIRAGLGMADSRHALILSLLAERISVRVFKFSKENNADVAQLVEHNLAKVGVASSNLVIRSQWA